LTAKFYILPDAEAVSLRAGVLFVELSKIAIASKGRFTVALSGGATPLRLFELLSTKYNKDIQWDKTGIFWVDERCVAPDNKDSNFKASYDALISRIDIPSANVHRIMGEMAPENGAREYEEKLKKYFENSGFPAFDLVILGVGQDGHTASLFPESEALSERERIAVPVYVEKLHKWRITLTLPVLNNALSILFLVTGVKKAGILKEILENERKREKYPAGHIQPLQGDVKWLIDKEAAVGLRADLSEKTRFFNVR
jgi:6-phosphogluconolactonase